MASPAKGSAEKENDVSNTRPLTAEKPSGPRSRKGIETRARLVTAAKEVFEESGFLDARISDIAERAGLSHGSFYHYFESKEEVFREVAAEVDDRLSAPLDSVIFDSSSHASPSERIRQAIRLTWSPTATRRASWASLSRCHVSTPIWLACARYGRTRTSPPSRNRSGACSATGWWTAASTRGSPPRPSAP